MIETMKPDLVFLRRDPLCHTGTLLELTPQKEEGGLDPDFAEHFQDLFRVLLMRTVVKRQGDLSTGARPTETDTLTDRPKGACCADHSEEASFHGSAHVSIVAYAASERIRGMP